MSESCHNYTSVCSPVKKDACSILTGDAAAAEAVNTKFLVLKMKLEK